MRGARPAEALARRFERAATWERNERIVVALSGGSDSVAAAGLAADFAGGGENIICAHIAHGLRHSGAQDEAVAFAVATALGARFVVRRISASTTAEAELRTLRYEALTAIARESGARVVITGHNASDQTETVLMQLFRGTAQTELGMAPERELAPGIRLIRPVLELDRMQLRRSCERRGLPYAIDPTNASLDYTRNAVRQMLPALREHFPGLERAVARYAKKRGGGAGDDQRFAAMLHILRAELSTAGFEHDIDAERLEALARIVELGAGRRVRISFLERESRSVGTDAVRNSIIMNAAPPNPAPSQGPPTLEPPLSHIIYDAPQIAAAVRTLAVEILCGTPYSGKLVLLMVLEGARRFGEDLYAIMAALPQAKHRHVELASVGVSSYAGELQSSGVVKITQSPSIDLADKHVIIVDDILDQGHTMRTLLEYCANMQAKTVKSCVLFDKRDVLRSFTPDFAGLEVPPLFVVGYGLDYKENFRTLPYLAALDPTALPRKIPDDAQASAG